MRIALTDVGLILSSTLDVIGYIRRSLAQRYRANLLSANFKETATAYWNNFVASITPLRTVYA